VLALGRFPPERAHCRSLRRWVGGAEAEEVVAVRRIDPAAKGGAAASGDVVPAATPEDPVVGTRLTDQVHRHLLS
jgi:hypothetical protein